MGYCTNGGNWKGIIGRLSGCQCGRIGQMKESERPHDNLRYTGTGSGHFVVYPIGIWKVSISFLLFLLTVLLPPGRAFTQYDTPTESGIRVLIDDIRVVCGGEAINFALYMQPLPHRAVSLTEISGCRQEKKYPVAGNLVWKNMQW